MVDTILGFLGKAITFLVTINILVLAHELGHYVAGRWAGVRIKEFGLGFPPRIVAAVRGGITYSLNWLPIGGFVLMAGEEDPNEPGSLAGRPRPWRLLVLSAGVIMNLVLAFVLLTTVYLVGEKVYTGRIVITDVRPGSPAAAAGMEIGDVIVRIDDRPLKNSQELQTYTLAKLGQMVTVTVQRDGQSVNTSLIPRPNPPAGEGPMGIALTMTDLRGQLVQHPLPEAMLLGARRTVYLTGAIVGGFVMLLRAPQSTQVAGPIGMARIIDEVAQTGLINLLELMAFLSINLAILNILPFPALDGGRIVFLLLEVVRGGRRLNPRYEGLVHFAGFAFLIGLMLIIAYFDLMNLDKPILAP